MPALSDSAFFYKEYILILIRYQSIQSLQQCIALAAVWMHVAKKNEKKNYVKKEKSPYIDYFLVAAVLTPPR
jgi:hypothetical protein